MTEKALPKKEPRTVKELNEKLDGVITQVGKLAIMVGAMSEKINGIVHNTNENFASFEEVVGQLVGGHNKLNKDLTTVTLALNDLSKALLGEEILFSEDFKELSKESNDVTEAAILKAKGKLN